MTIQAYKREAELIAKYRPALNIAKGGKGSRATPIRTPRKPQWQIDIERIGTREYCRQALEHIGIHIEVPWGYWDTLNG